MPRKLTYLLVLFLLLDTAFSFIQHLHFPHDGDLFMIVAPNYINEPVLSDPFGFKGLAKGEPYGAPNRFFAHWSMCAYFDNVPLWLQAFVSPIQSTYLATAIAKILIQLSLLWILTAYITGSFRNRYTILAAAIMAPLFQTTGFYDSMGLIDKSVTYTFFYPLPMVLVLLFFYPFYKAYVLNKGFSRHWLVHLLLVAGLVIIPFHGPISTGIITVVCPAALLYFWIRGIKAQPGKPLATRLLNAIGHIPTPMLVYFISIGLISLYSLYLGTYNEANKVNVPLADRYERLPMGLYYQLFYEKGYYLLFLLLAFAVWQLKKLNTPQSNKLMRIGLWIGLLSVIYVILLPLGGFRPYREFVVRRDTFMPVILCMYYFFGACTLFLIANKALPSKFRRAYTLLLVAVLAIFTAADHDTTTNAYVNEKKALKQIAASTERLVVIRSDTPILDWEIIADPYRLRYQSQVLQRWRITNDLKEISVVPH